MSDHDSRYLDAFSAWLDSLGDTARVLAGAVGNPALPDGARRGAAVALGYLFKSVDLIPDGIQDLGFIDDAFVCRVAVALGSEAPPGEPAPGIDAALAELVAEAVLIEEFLGSDYGRLVAYLRALGTAEVRGRSIDQVLEDADSSADLVAATAVWADEYRAPELIRDGKSLVKIRAFFNAKLPV